MTAPGTAGAPAHGCSPGRPPAAALEALAIPAGSPSASPPAPPARLPPPGSANWRPPGAPPPRGGGGPGGGARARLGPGSPELSRGGAYPRLQPPRPRGRHGDAEAPGNQARGKQPPARQAAPRP